jgi:hypothetical protein
VLAELKTRSALRDARAQLEIFSKHLGANRATGILLYTHGKGDKEMMSTYRLVCLRRSMGSQKTQQQAAPM